MGFAASQGRMLSLYIRKSDVEYKAQQINSKRTRLAEQTEEASSAYNAKIRNMKISIHKNDGEDVLLSQANLALVNLKAITIDNKDIEFPDTVSTDEQKAAYLQRGLYNDTIKLVALADVGEKKAGSEIAWRSNSAINEDYDESDDARAYAEFDAKTKELNAQDRVLEVDLKNIDTQHNAVQTEIDSVKKVIDRDIDMTFKTFG